MANLIYQTYICFYGIFVLEGWNVGQGKSDLMHLTGPPKTGQYCIFIQVFCNKKVLGNIKTSENRSVLYIYPSFLQQKSFFATKKFFATKNFFFCNKKVFWQHKNF